jgi:glycosyltransferase involved in cell wall biosynthesis
MKYKKGVSVFILTRNSEKSLRLALESVKWADEIIISDGFSEDNTHKICKEYGCKIFLHKFEGYEKERNFAISKCTHEWILEIDSDEEITNELKQNILKELQNPSYEVYALYRQDFFMKRLLNNLKLIRLYKNGIVKYFGTTHERVILTRDVKIGMLKGYLRHNADDSDTVFQPINRWDVEIEREIINPRRFKKNKRMNRFLLYYHMFIYPYILVLGLLFYKKFIFRGFHAVIWCVCAGFYEFLIYAKYYEVYYLKVRKFEMKNTIHPYKKE